MNSESVRLTKIIFTKTTSLTTNHYGVVKDVVLPIQIYKYWDV